MIDHYKASLCEKLGIPICDWEPGDALILYAIESEITEPALIQLAYADYLATPRMPDTNPSDKEAAPPASDDLIRTSHQSSERLGMRRHLSGNERTRDTLRRGPRQMVTRRREGSELNIKSHTPKYARQDYTTNCLA